MKTCIAEEFSNHADFFIDAGISSRGFEKAYLYPLILNQLKTYFLKINKIPLRYGNTLFVRPPLKLVLKLIFLWQIKTPFLIIKRIFSYKKIRPLRKIYDTYIEDQFISYCVRYAGQGDQKSYVYKPNIFLFLKAFYSFSYSYFAAKSCLSLLEKNVSECFVTHEIYNYAAFVRTLSNAGIHISIPLKLPFSYTIYPEAKYEKNKFPPFLDDFYRKYNNSVLSKKERLIASDYIKKRIDPNRAELSYLNESPYAAKYDFPSNLIIKDYNKNNNQYFVLFLHAFTDDLHRYGFDDFDSIWQWTIFTIKKIIEKTDKTIFIKIHPNQDINSIHLVNRMDAEAVDDLKKEFINEYRVIFLSNKFSNKDIISSESSAIVITHHGNIVCEASYYGIKCISSKMSPWNILSNVECWTSKEEYSRVLISLSKSPIKKISNYQNLYKAIINYYYDRELVSYKPYYYHIMFLMHQKGNKLFDRPIDNYSRRETYEKLFLLYKTIQINKEQDLYDEIVDYLGNMYEKSNFIRKYK